MTTQNEPFMQNDITVERENTSLGETAPAASVDPAQAASTAGGGQKPYLVFIEGLRALAALVVVFNHIYLELWLDRGLPPAPFGFLSYLLIFGHLSVSVFIVISGFCLMLPTVKHGGELRGGVGLFLKRRFRRILPPYYFSLAFTLFFIYVVFRGPGGTHFDTAMIVRKTDFISHLLLLQNAYGAGRISYVYWSIATEFQIYFFFPLLLLALRRYGSVAATVGTLIVGFVLAYALRDTRFVRVSPQYIGLFTLGMAAAWAAFGTEPRLQAFRARFPFGLTAAIGALVTLLLAALLGWENSTAQQPFYDLPVGVFAACLLIVASLHPQSGARRVCSWRPLVWIGTFSYSLYLIHVPILVFMVRYVLPPLHIVGVGGFVFLVVFGLPIVILAAYGFHLACERPFMNARKAA